MRLGLLHHNLAWYFRHGIVLSRYAWAINVESLTWVGRDVNAIASGALRGVKGAVRSAE